MRKALFFLLATTAAVSAQPYRASLSSARSHYFLGENVLIEFCLTNTGDQPLELDVGGDYRGAPRSLRFQVEGWDAAGRALADPHPNPVCFGGLSCRPRLKPGESFRASLALPHYRRVARAGRVHLRVRHDLGWKTPAVAEMDLQFDQPDPAQAERVLQQQCKLPSQVSVTLGQPTPPFQDLWTLSYPVYLGPLQRAGQVVGVGQILGREATESLLGMAEKPELRSAAAHQLTLRLPLTQAANHFEAAERKRLAQGAWSPPLKVQARQLALSLLAGQDSDIKSGAAILAALGQAPDVEAVQQQLDVRLPRNSTYPRPAGPPYDLEQALVSLLRRFPDRAHKPVSRPSWLLGQLSLPHPTAQVVALGLQSPAARVRELAVLASPRGQESLLGLLADPDPGVQVAVCERLPGHPALLELVGDSQDEWVVRAASSASLAHRRACAEKLAPRLGEARLWRVVLEQLLQMTMTRVNGYSSDGEPDATERERLVQAWQKYLKDQAAALEEGKTASRLPAELLPRGFRLTPP